MRIHNAVIAGEVSVETLKSELDYGMDIQIETDWTDVLEDVKVRNNNEFDKVD